MDIEKQWPRGQRAAFVANFIRDQIVSGELAASTRINERVLTEQLGVSRTPLREAFKILESEGLLTIEPNRGAMVTAISPQEVELAIEVLIALESVAAERACKHATDAQIDEIQALHDEMVGAWKAGALMRYFHINQTIHQKIVDCAANPTLSRLYMAESQRIRRFRYAGNQISDRWARAVYEHEQILDALRHRQGALLREVLRSHHLSGWRTTRAVLEGEIRL
ncbi:MULTISPECIES: GntR family transcriptional regulator [Paracoccus]|uniref:Transcriptional regulator, GntR family n=1 Tax=Paracoccus denitrificans (strain Pd 1222) TaxID=318586 RepID=A1B7G8_PARDP|nr:MULTISPECIES: GntR family transcriptional regulator [Paracoccus]ABL71462.1 transcriptional regulator, GntR family [Paracoccus denitrificans PD1222]MBB4629660.1 DNA-binding GntR family transcriptional regulator [Paracoccus denitrificans]MCU7430679.1 GntR family transcriptional regulator [Paracoccus denitrificans]MDF3855812.1 GntR family transcriptional regulator [Paracoccus pantotrophus]UPV97798.1 GntR family transcriptional regulator [Paracoccus denitrificans]